MPIGPGAAEVVLDMMGSTRVYRLGDVGPSHERCGAFERLRNLGHAFDDPTKPIDAREELEDEHLQQALLAFQRGHGLDASGELDEATQARLAEVYGI